MKKTIALILTVVLTVSFATIALADDPTTVLTTEVPDATYTLHIPEDQTITFGEPKTTIGNVSVSDSSNFAVGKNLEVMVAYDSFKSDDVNTTIPFDIVGINETKSTYSKTFKSGDTMIFEGQYQGYVNSKTIIGSFSDGKASYPVYMDAVNVVVKSEDWGKALAGEYSSVITFTAEVVAE